ncbi:Tda1 [Kluyveromyces lactis]|nr:Tda1 [Kluyveromyces lactis]
MSIATSDYSRIDDKVWPTANRTGPKEDPSKYHCTYVTKKVALGDGHFSVVKECMNTMTGDRYAMKLVHKSLVMDKLQLIQREVSVLKRVSSLIRELETLNQKVAGSGSNHGDVFEGHHHVLQLFDFFETSKSIVLVTQLCESEDLYDKILNAGHLDLETQVKPFTACLLSALQFLHGNGIIHRDLKAENVLFRLKTKTNMIELPRDDAMYDKSAHDLILADFGLAISTETGSKEFVGTISYLAPELVACKNSGKQSSIQNGRLKPYGTGVDVWALGVLCYFMACGYMPFDCETDAETMEYIANSDYYMDEDMAKDDKYKQFWSFLEKCFEVDMDKRASADELSAHSFVCPQYFPNKSPTPIIDSPRAPALRVSKSSTSLHSLEPPSRSASTVSLNLNEPMRRSDSREVNLNRIRETLRKTLSMTSIKREPNVLLNVPSGSNSANFNRASSTFKLEPEPPNVALMNGCLCATPESCSNFTTSPSMSRNGSKNNLQTAIGSWNESSLSGLNSGATLTFDRNSFDFTKLNNTSLSPSVPTSSSSNDARKDKIVFQLGEDD